MLGNSEASGNKWTHGDLDDTIRYPIIRGMEKTRTWLCKPCVLSDSRSHGSDVPDQVKQLNRKTLRHDPDACQKLSGVQCTSPLFVFGFGVRR